MLQRLHIVDLAIIEEVDLALTAGFNVLTGETGAGKSIIVEAAEVLRGGRASSELVRSGRKGAVVEALFDLGSTRHAGELLAQVEQAGLPVDGSELLIRRVIPASGRSRVYVNGALCTAAVLARVTGSLLDISGQHEHQLLSDSTTHRRLLDELGTPPELLQQMAGAHQQLKQASAQLASSQLDDRERSRRLEFLRYQLTELEQAELVSGEDHELTGEHRRLERAAELMEAALQGEQDLYGAEGAVAERLSHVRTRLQSLAAVDPVLTPWAAQLEEARLLVEDVGQSLGRYGSAMELQPGRLEQLESRLDVIHRLCRKHAAPDVEALIELRQQLQREQDQLRNLEQRRGQLEREVQVAREQARALAERLSATRRQAAELLARQVTRQLRELRMAGALLDVSLSPLPRREGDDEALCFDDWRLGARGRDRVEFCIRTNKGEELRPLRRVASGGELSRVMLALRKTLGAHDPVLTSIYDEVDAGIGGAVADVVGRTLAEVSRHRQVLCVTHLPQVAAHADHHIHVGKQTRGRRVVTAVETLEPQARVEELARMLGGETVSEAARDNARQLLAAARSVKA